MKNFVLTLLLFSFTFMISCKSLTNKKENEVVLKLAPYRVSCTGAFPQKCYVTISENGEKELFYEGIKGFDFEPGYEYELLVYKKARCDYKNNIQDCPQDVGFFEYSLSKIISKKVSKDTYKEDFK